MNSVLRNKPIHEDEQSEQRVRKRRRHERVRYYSSPESNGHSRSSSVQRNYDDPALSESSSKRREKRLAHARRFGIDPPKQTVEVSIALYSFIITQDHHCQCL
ncbi:unnamed protein product [Litomosoides sigmodontis]|uniref:Uncharacterized protein n=1 Tax=Litomosoides sigmodontis TaxID=42156 RepID=A0A3P7LXE0_LITSI|nr:unnamed protein product [Litomosoides sigmodontis]